MRTASIAVKCRNGQSGGGFGFLVVEADDPEKGAAKVVEIVRDRIPRRFGLDPIRDIQVLCPMQRGALGARSLNVDLQKALNPNPPAKIENLGRSSPPATRSCRPKMITTAMSSMATLERYCASMRLKASSSPASTARGRISFWRTRHCRSRLCDDDPQVARFGISGGRHHARDPALHHAGRNLVYTAVTRGKRLVVIVGHRRAMAIAVRNWGAARLSETSGCGRMDRNRRYRDDDR